MKIYRIYEIYCWQTHSGEERIETKNVDDIYLTLSEAQERVDRLVESAQRNNLRWIKWRTYHIAEEKLFIVDKTEVVFTEGGESDVRRYQTGV